MQSGKINIRDLHTYHRITNAILSTSKQKKKCTQSINDCIGIYKYLHWKLLINTDLYLSKIVQLISTEKYQCMGSLSVITFPIVACSCRTITSKDVIDVVTACVACSRTIASIPCH